MASLASFGLAHAQGVALPMYTTTDYKLPEGSAKTRYDEISKTNTKAAVAADPNFAGEAGPATML